MLLLEKLRTKSSSSQENAAACMPTSPYNGAHLLKNHYPTMEQQRRRPSSIAEQAMRKLGISNASCYTRNEPLHRQHSPSIMSSCDKPLDGMPAVIQLRDTSIREQCASPTATSNMHLFRDNGAVGYGRGSYIGLTRDRIERDCTSPSYGPYSLSSSGRDSACHMSRDSSMNNGFPSRTPSSRLLASGSIDQRIMKQSTEDCRRLLQQVCEKMSTFIAG